MNYSVQRLILGTHTNDSETNYLMIGEVRLPTPDPKALQEKYEDSCDIYGGFGGAAGKIEITERIIHDGEVNRARYMPHNPNIIATKTKYSHINIFDRTKHESKPSKGGKCKPLMVLTGHAKEGYGIDWNPFEEGLLLSGSYDNLICLWDIKQITSNASSNNANSSNNNSLRYNPRTTYKSHTNRVEDVAWHRRHANIFASVSDDKTLRIWDYKRHDKSQNVVKEAHKDDINCVSFSHTNEYLLATGGSDKLVALWDMRNLTQKLHSLEGHMAQIYQVSWCPHSEVHLASCSGDRHVNLWDLSQIGMEQSAEDAEDGPPELLFVHGGHTDKVLDFSWNPHDPFVIASVADNNIVQVWQMTDELLTHDDLTQHAQLE